MINFVIIKINAKSITKVTFKFYISIPYVNINQKNVVFLTSILLLSILSALSSISSLLFISLSLKSIRNSYRAILDFN